VKVPARFRDDDVAGLNVDGSIELLPAEVVYHQPAAGYGTD
jgi:hypothetical protein